MAINIHIAAGFSSHTLCKPYSGKKITAYEREKQKERERERLLIFSLPLSFPMT